MLLTIPIHDVIETDEFAGSPYNDVFAWFLNDQNIAIIESTGEPVSINTINRNKNSHLYRINDPFDENNPSDAGNDINFPNMEADGFTVMMTAKGQATSGTNHMKLVIADRDDQMFDSWAMFKSSSFRYVPPGGGGGGDPHFRRWSHETRDTFHGECDLVVMHSDNFHNKAGLDFHVRTTMHEGMYSYIDSAAVRVGEHIVEIQNGKVLYFSIFSTLMEATSSAIAASIAAFPDSFAASCAYTQGDD